MKTNPATRVHSNPCGRLLPMLAAAGLALALSGCVTKSAAQARAKAAYQAGRRDALLELQQNQMQSVGTSVRVNGPVHNTVIPWTQGLTLKRAILTADYNGPVDPAEILVVRRGVATHLDLNQLLSGADMPLQPGDIVQLILPQGNPAPEAGPAQGQGAVPPTGAPEQPTPTPSPQAGVGTPTGQ